MAVNSDSGVVPKTSHLLFGALRVYRATEDIQLSMPTKHILALENLSSHLELIVQDRSMTKKGYHLPKIFWQLPTAHFLMFLNASLRVVLFDMQSV